VLHTVYQMPMGVLNAMVARVKLLGRMDVVESAARWTAASRRATRAATRWKCACPPAHGLWREDGDAHLRPENTVKDLDALGFCP
jgi:general secretion pathway protein E